MLTTVKIKTAKPQERPYKLADSGGLYLLVAEVALPADADVVALSARIGEVASDLGVRATFHVADTDVL